MPNVSSAATSERVDPTATPSLVLTSYPFASATVKLANTDDPDLNTLTPSAHWYVSPFSVVSGVGAGPTACTIRSMTASPSFHGADTDAPDEWISVSPCTSRTSAGCST